MTLTQDPSTFGPVPSLAELAKQALDAKRASEAASRFDAAQTQWSRAVSAAKAKVRQVFNRDPDSIDFTDEPREGRRHYVAVNRIYLKLDQWWVAYDVKDRTLRLATDKCLVRARRLCSSGEAFDDLAGFGLALERTVDGVIPRPGTTSHWHFDDAGHLISHNGYVRRLDLAASRLSHLTDAQGRLPNDRKPIAYEG